MNKSVHDMPFGATVRDDGVAFRFYAPDCESVELVVGGRPPLLMTNEPEGWKSALVGARVGQDYSFRLPGGLTVPDPASRYQPRGLPGPSRIVDPRSYAWRDEAWRGRPWHEAVIYEAHVGTATPAGDYAGLMHRLDALADLGVTAIELMPLAQWRGERNWGYDGVLPFAPSAAYGSPDDLKALIDRAHELRMMVIIDVVYNHFGPSGNYLHSYASSFFTDRHETPWGAAINFDSAGRDAVRAFFKHNARYWIEEFHADGLRLDAVHAIIDDSKPHILEDIAADVRQATPEREIHLILENDLNQARWLARGGDGLTPVHYTAQWNDDAHHCWHALLTGESDGYYADFADDAPARLARSLAEGYVYQGDPSAFRKGELRGERSAHLHPTAFIDFIQNHDQVGNRALGDRIDTLAEARRVALARAAILLSPHIPMLFMGEEWGARTPFLYFVDFNDEPDLAAAVREGRRREFEGFREFAEGGGAQVPDPNGRDVFLRSRLDYRETRSPAHAAMLEETRRALQARREHVTPLLASRFQGANWRCDHDASLIDVIWRFDAGALRLVMNIGEALLEIDARGSLAYAGEGADVSGSRVRLSPWSMIALRS